MKRICFVGKPNTGKTSLFNLLTGLKQKTGNYPGTTIDKVSGIIRNEWQKIQLLDLPGTYSLSASSSDEQIVTDVLCDDSHPDFPDKIILVADAVNIKQCLYLLTQILELGIPTVLAINRIEKAKKKGISIDEKELSKILGCKVFLISVNKKIGIEELKKELFHFVEDKNKKGISLYSEFLKSKSDIILNDNTYIMSYKKFINLGKSELTTLKKVEKNNLNNLKIKERIFRHQRVSKIVKDTFEVDFTKASDLSARIDKIFTHSIFGYIIFAIILLIIFQSIFTFAVIPMDYIDLIFSDLSSWVHDFFPSGVMTNLIADGIIPGIAGVVIFVPQIAILFLFISILEESGYMARVVYLMDQWMRKFGMSGKSVVPLISGVACAIPAIMATRNIENNKEKLITILVTPFMTCSARIPVYAILISLIIPDYYIGIFHSQALVLLGMYLLGILAALLSGIIANKLMYKKRKSYLLLELPSYKIPILRNLWITIIDRTKSFVFEAGKIIVAVSVLLWVLATNGFDSVQLEKEAKIQYSKQADNKGINFDNYLNSYKLENSYLGKLGKYIEPAVSPLGYDWKIGIALMSSVAAREVFIGTLATIYGVENSNSSDTIKSRMNKEVSDDGTKVFSFQVGISLLIFYAFALQCISTIVIVYKETKSWKWPLIQFGYMSIVAYISAWLAFQLLK